MATILVVDDDPLILRSFAHVLKLDSHEVIAVSSVADALEALATTSIALVISDGEMPEATGSALAHIIAMQHAHVPVVLITGLPPERVRLSPEGLSVVRSIVQKPIAPPELLALIRRILATNAA